MLRNLCVWADSYSYRVLYCAGKASGTVEYGVGNSRGQGDPKC